MDQRELHGGETEHECKECGDTAFSIIITEFVSGKAEIDRFVCQSCGAVHRDYGGNR